MRVIVVALQVCKCTVVLDISIRFVGLLVENTVLIFIDIEVRNVHVFRSRTFALFLCKVFRNTHTSRIKQCFRRNIRTRFNIRFAVFSNQCIIRAQFNSAFKTNAVVAVVRDTNGCTIHRFKFYCFVNYNRSRCAYLYAFTCIILRTANRPNQRTHRRCIITNRFRKILRIDGLRAAKTIGNGNLTILYRYNDGHIIVQQSIVEIMRSCRQRCTHKFRTCFNRNRVYVRCRKSVKRNIEIQELRCCIITNICTLDVFRRNAVYLKLAADITISRCHISGNNCSS